MLFLSTAAFTSFMIGYLAGDGFSLEIIASIIGCGFIVGAIYFIWILKTQKIKDIKS